MSYNHTRNYFDFKGVRYGVGTVVKIKLEPHGSRREIERCGGIAKFVKGFDSGYLKFSGIVPLGETYCGIAIISNPEDRIEKILEPVYYNNKDVLCIAIDNYRKTPKERRADISPGTIFYIAAMLVGTIFNARIGIWALSTLFYLKYLVNIYRD